LTFNGLGIPIAATGLLYPVCAMAAMAVSVTSIFVNWRWGWPQLLFQALLSVGRPQQPELRGRVNLIVVEPLAVAHLPGAD
jgi:hypothetical protein